MKCNISESIQKLHDYIYTNIIYKVYEKYRKYVYEFSENVKTCTGVQPEQLKSFISQLSPPVNISEIPKFKITKAIEPGVRDFFKAWFDGRKEIVQAKLALILPKYLELSFTGRVYEHNYRIFPENLISSIPLVNLEISKFIFYIDHSVTQ